jgi:hypothetical protein
MRHKNRYVIVILFSLAGVLINGHEDRTHQALTNQAVEVAKPMIGTELINLRQSIIAGAGAGAGPEARGNPAGKIHNTDGEDYTIYTIHRKCPVHYKPTKNDKEPLSHFMPKGLWGHPAAINQFYRFFQDAVFLWKHDKKGEAATIRLSGGF